MKLAYVGDFHNHGTTVTTTGTPLVYLLSELDFVDSVDVYCPPINLNVEKTFIPENVNIVVTYDPERSLSTLNLFKIDWKKYDMVLFNIIPTMFGKSSLINLIGTIVPYSLTKLGFKNVRVILHNSTHTNDVERLGYRSRKDKIRRVVLSVVEKLTFNNVKIYFPLKLYVNAIRSQNKRSRVEHIDMKYLEGITTVYLNGKNKEKFLTRKKRIGNVPVVLLHGYWGPQKNLDLALSKLTAIRNRGVKFHLVLSGGMNKKFPGYKEYFEKLIKKYNSTIDEFCGYVVESEILPLFLRTDIVLIPYNTPGGHSGVLETALFFERKVICISYPEYVEQSEGHDNVTMTDYDRLEEVLEKCFLSLPIEVEKSQVSIYNKMEKAKEAIKVLLK